MLFSSTPFVLASLPLCLIGLMAVRHFANRIAVVVFLIADPLAESNAIFFANAADWKPG